MKLKSMMFLMVTGLVSLSSQATVMKDSSTDELTKIAYTCDNNKVLNVVFVNTNRNSYAIINDVDEMIPMQITKSASGSMYKAISPNYTYKLHTKGGTAELFGDKDILFKNCVTE